MSHSGLGLFDTPPSRGEIRVAIAIVILLVAVSIMILPIATMRIPEQSAFVPSINSVILASDLVIAALLYAQAGVFRSRALTVLASGYVFTGLLLIPHALAFPGAFAAKGLFGAGLDTTAWVAIFRRLAFPVAVTLYAMLKAKDLASEPELEAPPAGNVGAVAATVALALFATLVAFRGQGFLPSLFVNEREVNFAHHIAVNSAAIALAIVPMIMLMRQRPSVLDLWLLVALAAWVIEAVLNLPLHARYSAGWYGLFLMMLASSLVVMLALLADSNRLYARLALSTAAREREREARLMTADAVAAAIAHEVGQPLAAVSANVAASVRWLDRPQPNVEKATDSLRAIGESTQRSFDIIENVRAVLGKGPDGSVEFSLNELIRETAATLGGELAGAKVSLELSLDDDVPPIKANRVQIEQVLINLLTNAVESLVSTRGRRRRIGVRTALAESGRIRLEVSDNGVGLTPENVSNVFDAFHTTKSKGTGIGLSLCRTIVEEHGGRIWASRGDKHGATFHMLLPCARIAASAAKSKP